MSSRKQYPFNLIEPKWQQFWDEQQSFRAFNPGEVLPLGHPFAKRHGLEGKTVSAADLPPKFYVLDMFPYPSGAGLHVGHPEGYTATDILARYKRAAGSHVLHPMGWDSFGLPAEQYAVKTGQHPRVTTEANIANFTRQIKSLGFSYDWSREVATTDPEYFRWTQWIFLQIYNSWFNPETNKVEPVSFFDDIFSEKPRRKDHWGKNLTWLSLHTNWLSKHGQDRDTFRREIIDGVRLAYVAEIPVWWCPELGTVLANEEVTDGKSEVGGFPAFQKPMRQWLLRITAYADRLANDLDTIDWSPALKEMQRNWIGKREGAHVIFKIEGSDKTITVFTTRPDTLFGATFMVLAPEHPLVALQPEGIVPHEWPKDKCVLDLTPNAFPSPSTSFPNRGSCKQDIPWHAVRMCREMASAKSERERLIHKEKLGVPTGAFAINPITGQRIPIWIGDYVLSSYGTGAIMAVPAHDQRDLEFALEFGGLEIPVVVGPAKNWLKEHFKPSLESIQYAQQVEKALAQKENVDWSNGALGQAVIDLVNRTGIRFADTVRLLEHCRELRAGTLVEEILPDLYQRFPQFFSDGKLPATFAEEGIAVNSANVEISLNGLPTPEAKAKITTWLEAKGLGKKTINYKLRDWLFSRQRYWGEPFPITWKRDANGALYHEALPESALPLLPPPLDDYKPTPDGQPPLARAKDWVTLPDGAMREVNTMPQWAGSCWYYLRYLDAKNGSAFVSREAEEYWMGATASSPFKVQSSEFKVQSSGSGEETLNLEPRPLNSEQKAPTPGVDLYVGGTEHAVLHLLYARFWHKILFDLGHVSTPEPFFKLVNQGLILGEDGQKMSKSRGNTVNPDDVLAEFGADAFRLYEMFMGPLEMVKPWNTQGVSGVYKFLGRVWRLFVDEASEVEFEQASTTAEAAQQAELLKLIKLNAAIRDTEPTKEQLKALHACIKKVTEDLDGMRFNTAISAMMVFVNEALAWETKPVAVLREFLILLQPFAPHLAEELWEKLSKVQSPQSKVTNGGAATLNLEPWTLDLAYQPWPKFDPALLVEDTLEIPVQVNGKLRDVIRVPAAATSQEIEATALKSEKAQQFLVGKTVKKVIVVPKKLVNIVAV